MLYEISLYIGLCYNAPDSIWGAQIASKGSLMGIFFKANAQQLCTRVTTVLHDIMAVSNESNGISYHWQLNCLFHSLFRLTVRKHLSSKLLAICEGTPPITSWYLSQRPIMPKACSYHDRCDIMCRPMISILFFVCVVYNQNCPWRINTRGQLDIDFYHWL